MLRDNWFQNALHLAVSGGFLIFGAANLGLLSPNLGVAGGLLMAAGMTVGIASDIFTPVTDLEVIDR